MISTIKILSWNANGLLQKQYELQAVLDTNNIDICLISETHFNKQSFIKLKGYKIYHTTHPSNTSRGGSAVIIKENIKHHEDSKYQTNEIQATVIQVHTKTYTINVAGIYCPPRHSLRKEEYIKFLQSLGKRFIVGGDFNAKNLIWGSRLTSPKGKELLSAIQEIGCDFISTGKPTYWPTDRNKIPDLIDFFITKNVSYNFLQIDENHELHSDHTAILLTLSETIIKKPININLCNKYTDWISFKMYLEDKINLQVPIKTKDELDMEVKLFIENIQNAAWLSTPEIRTKLKGNNYPAEIKTLLSEKRKARKKWHQTRHPTDKNILNRLSQQLRREIMRIKNDSINHYLSQLTNEKSSDYSLWKATKVLKRPIVQIPPLKESNGNWAKCNMQKANIFSAHLENIFKQEEDATNIELTVDVEEQNKNVKATTVKEILQEINFNLSVKKAPGFDQITGEILRHLPKKAIVKLMHIMNAAFRMQYVPKLWKIAEVIMIPKPGKPPHEVSSYRPISLLPVLSKLFEKLLLKRIMPIIENKKIIPNHQFGFRNQHSTIDQVHRITNVIEKALEEKKVCSAIFLDVAQAFDKVWHEGLIYKIRLNFPKQFSNILESYLSDRWFRVKQEDSYSELKQIEAGVPQGSVLGPVLYLIYTSDLPTLETNTTATFADDTAILAVGETNEESVAKVQKAMVDITRWTTKWRIKLNESKSVHVDFTNKRINYKPIFINDKQIPYANTAKYLGMTLDSKLRWKAHVKKKREELGLKYRKMHWLIGRKSELSIYNKLLLYKQIIKPIWTYGIQLWGCTKKSNINIIQQFQNKVLRSIVNAPWYIRNDDLHRDLQVEHVTTVVQKFAESHKQRLLHHVNEEAVQLLDTSGIVRRLKRLKPHDLV